MIKQINPRNK